MENKLPSGIFANENKEVLVIFGGQICLDGGAAQNEDGSWTRELGIQELSENHEIGEDLGKSTIESRDKYHPLRLVFPDEKSIDVLIGMLAEIKQLGKGGIARGLAKQFMNEILYDNDFINRQEPFNEEKHYGPYLDQLEALLSKLIKEFGSDFFTDDFIYMFTCGEYDEVVAMCKKYPSLEELRVLLDEYFEWLE